jgi:hypothetical protein
MPIATFIGSIWYLAPALILRRPISGVRIVVWVSVLAASLVAIVAWFTGYRLAADHEIKKFILVQILGSLIFSGVVFSLPRNAAGELLPGSKIYLLSSRENLLKAAYSVGMYLAICFVFFISISFFREPYDCDSALCRQAKILVGNPEYSLDKIWGFCALSCSAPFACALNLLAALRKSRN